MVAGLDSNGSLFISLLQSNSNSQVMKMFFSHFLEHLDEKSPGWRKTTVLLQDGAAYHTSEVMMEFYEKHSVPIIFTGPHSYAASPIELFFAAFKRADINPAALPTGKR